MPSARVSSGLHSIATITGLRAAAEEFVTTTVTASTARVSLERIAPPPSHSTRPRRLLWARVQPALSTGGLVAARGPARPTLALAAVASDAVAGDAADRNVVDIHVVDSDAVHGDVFDSGAAERDVFGGDVVDMIPQVTSPKPPSAIARVELTIDSLHNYELIRPIPVVVESLGERNFVAEMPDLNISTTASNQSDILITLKDRITQVYDALRIKKNLDIEQARQLRFLETYIGKSRRGWLDRR
jgi:hypothetical protein